MSVRAVVQPASQIAADVARGLSSHPKSLPPRLFYDAAGSQLFELITALPEYYLTATERAIFEQHASEMVEGAGSEVSVVELGAGSAAKSSILLGALTQTNAARVHYFPVDVSDAALQDAASRIRRQLPGISVTPTQLDYTSGLSKLGAVPGRKLVMYIGSSIGNFEPFEAAAILRYIRRMLRDDDALLLGTDMRKDTGVLLPAYDDQQGVTSRFNKNLLVRINRELDGNFDLSAFAHKVVWNSSESRIEMHLESLQDQVVRIRALGLTVTFSVGETIHTENSYKYTMRTLSAMAATAGLYIERTWSDPRQWFTVHRLRPSASRKTGC